jgi:Protein of unknown function (DUF3489)
VNIKLTETQRRLLTAAAQRDDRLIPPPPGLKGGAVTKAVANLLDAGLVRETPTEDKALVWRRNNNTKKALALKLTAVGLKACPPGPKAEAVAETAKVARTKRKAARARSTGAVAAVDSKTRPPRDGSKISQVIGLLEQESGATIDEIVRAMGWLPHTTRAALTGLRKRGFTIERREREAGPRSYAIVTSKKDAA